MENLRQQHEQNTNYKQFTYSFQNMAMEVSDPKEIIIAFNNVTFN